MRSALSRRIGREFTRRKTRSALTVATLTAAVAGVWLFATPQQLGAAMDERVAEDQIHDVILRPDRVALDAEEIARLRAIANVVGLEARALYFTEVQAGNRVQDVTLVGVADFDDQHVNVVRLESGSTPRPPEGAHEALTDPQNGRSGRFAGSAGDTITILGSGGANRALSITGEGSTAYYSNWAVDGSPVLYVPIETVWELGGFRTYTEIEFRVADRSDEATGAAIDEIRAVLSDARPDLAYRTLAELRPEGEWPGEDDFDNFLVLFWVIAGMSLLSAVVLIGTTMSTLVREQTREIGIMKAIGSRRRQIAVHFASIALLLGAAGTIGGVAIGLPLSNLLVDFLGTEFIGVDPGWRFSWLALALSLMVGIGGTILAALPAVLRGARLPVHDAISSRGLGSDFGQGALDRCVRRLGFLPRTLELGARSAVRRKGRSLATILQVSLAVGTLLGFSATLITMLEVSEQSRRSEGGDIQVWSTGEARLLDDGAVASVAAIDGVARVQPISGADVLVGDTDTFVWGLPPDPVYRYELDEGRWFTETENVDRELVAVVGPALSILKDVEVGDNVWIETPVGSTTVEVIGLDSTMVGDGLALFMPIETIMAMRGQSEPTQFWVETESSDHDAIDRTALAMRSSLASDGFGFDFQVRYIERDAERAQDRTITAVIMALGIPVVAIGMIGLVSTMTTNIIERSREIGVLRSLGARARDVRRFFRAEAVVLVVIGWGLGIGVGYAIGRVIMRFINDAFHVDFTLRYPLWPLGVALVMALAVAGLALARPLARASRLSPSEALRYE